MPSVETRRTPSRKESEKTLSSVIVYAGASPKRLLFLEHAFPSPQFSVVGKSGGFERDIDSTITIAREKIDFAIHRNPDVRRFMQNPANLTIATDVRTNPLTRYSLEGTPRTRSLRKPHGKRDVMKTFRRIARAAETSEPYYWVGSGTALRKKGRLDDARPDHMWAKLDPEMMVHFGTRPGIDEYEDAFNKFYQATSIYGDSPDSQPELTDIAGGMAFDVLVSLGAVKSVNGVEIGAPEFRNEVKKGIYLALLSFNLDILRPIKPDIYQIADNYPPLEHVTALAMGEIPLAA